MPRARTAAFGLLAVSLLAVTAFAGTPAHATVRTATCNNTTADDATIQTAITAANPGDVIDIDGGTAGICLIDATVKLRDDRTVRGHSRGVVIKQANSANLTAMFASGSWVDNTTFTSVDETVENLTFDGNKANNTSTSTVGLMLRTWNSAFRNLFIENTKGDGIRVTNLSANSTALTASSVNSVISDVYVTDAGGDGIHVTDTGSVMTDWHIVDGWIANPGGNAVGMDNAAGWLVSGLHLYGVQLDAILAKRCFGTRIVGNYVEDYGKQASSGTTYHGIYCNPAQDAAGTVIANNAVHHFGTYANGTFVGIQVDGPGSGTGRVAVSGNTVLGKSLASETGISYTGTLTVSSTGNQVAAVTTARSVGGSVTLTAGQ